MRLQLVGVRLGDTVLPHPVASNMRHDTGLGHTPYQHDRIVRSLSRANLAASPSAERSHTALGVTSSEGRGRIDSAPVELSVAAFVSLLGFAASLTVDRRL